MRIWQIPAGNLEKGGTLGKQGREMTVWKVSGRQKKRKMRGRMSREVSLGYTGKEKLKRATFQRQKIGKKGR